MKKLLLIIFAMTLSGCSWMPGFSGPEPPGAIPEGAPLEVPERPENQEVPSEIPGAPLPDPMEVENLAVSDLPRMDSQGWSKVGERVTPLGESVPERYFKTGVLLSDPRARPHSALLIECLAPSSPVIAVQIGRMDVTPISADDWPSMGRVLPREPRFSTEQIPVLEPFSIEWKKRVNYYVAVLHPQQGEEARDIGGELRVGSRLRVRLATEVGALYYEFDLAGFSRFEKMCGS